MIENKIAVKISNLVFQKYFQVYGAMYSISEIWMMELLDMGMNISAVSDFSCGVCLNNDTQIKI